MKIREAAREAKLNLRPGCAKIVATTPHSFKGWEASHLVVYVEKIESEKDRAAFYTALSRLKRHNNGAVLTVVSSCQELEQFGHDTSFLTPGSDSFDQDIFDSNISSAALP